MASRATVLERVIESHTTAHRAPICVSVKATSCAVICLLLLGCTTAPVVEWKRGDAAVAGDSMPAALRYLDSARDKYRETVAYQMRDERQLTNALIGAGALVTALAVGKVHRDAIIGTAFFAGTAYTLGGVNLQRPRVLIYQAGVEALNCVERAVTPFAISASEQLDLGKALEALEGARVRLSSELTAGRAFQNSLPPASSSRPKFTQAEAAAQLVMQSSESTLKAGREFNAAASRGARTLVSAVNGIDAAVVRSLINETPDLSSVPKLVSGLAGMAGSFAPGAGLESLVLDRLAAALKPSGAAGGQMAGAEGLTKEEKDMEQAIKNIDNAVRDVLAQQSNANARLTGRASAWPEDAFKDCGVAQVVSALAVSTPSLRFTVGIDGRRVVDITGGVKPYFLDVDGALIDGLMYPRLVRDGRAEIQFSAKATKAVETVLRISDSAATPRTVDLALSVVAAADTGTPPPALPASTAATAPGSGAAAPGSTAGAAADLDLLKKVGNFQFKGKTFSLAALPTLVGDEFSVRVVCPAGSPDVFKASELARELLKKAGVVEPPMRKVALTTIPASCSGQ